MLYYTFAKTSITLNTKYLSITSSEHTQFEMAEISVWSTKNIPNVEMFTVSVSHEVRPLELVTTS
jgi:hypothetical protein